MNSDHAFDGVPGSRVAYRTCPLCEATCGLEITVENGRVTFIRGDREDVLSQGYVCPKGKVLHKLDSDPDRLRRPLVRRGDSWEEVSWDDAFAEVERGLVPILESQGRDAVAVHLGNPNAHTIAGGLYVRPLLQMLRSKNIFSSSTVDQMPKQVSSGLLFGSAACVPIPDLDHTDYLLILGANPCVSNGSLCTAPNFPGRMRALRARGGKILVVDPSRTRTAQEADEHLYVRPGTDALFLLGVVHTLFEEGLVSLGHLADHVTGLDAMQHLARTFSPEAVAEACGIDAQTVRRIARELSAAPSAAVYGRIGTCAVAFGTITSWLIDVIHVLTGNLDRQGGAMFPEPAHVRGRTRPGGKGFISGRWHSRVKHLPEVCGELPVATLADEIETPGQGQVRALITVASNPILTAPNSRRLDRALASLDFMVGIDPYLNETTRHAKVILPPEPRLTQSQYDFSFYGLSVRNVANYSPPVFKREEDQSAEWQILMRLALVVGGQGSGADIASFDDLIISQAISRSVEDKKSSVAGRDPSALLSALSKRRGPERMLDWLLRTGMHGEAFGSNPEGLSLDSLEANPHGIDLGPLRPGIPHVLRTPSAKIELAPKPIMDDLSRLLATLQTPQKKGLVLVGRRHLRSCNSWGHNIGILVQGERRCTLQVHPEDAGKLGLVEGGLAKVSSRVGAVKAYVEITDRIMPGVVSLPYGWGHDVPGISLSIAAAHPGVNSNILTDDDQMDPLSGTSVLNGIPVTVERIAGRSLPQERV